MGYDFTAKWEAQRSTLVRRMTGINKKLMEMKFDRAMKTADEIQQRGDYPQIFMALAKEMLAEPIYNRIAVAAHHRHQDHLNERKRRSRC